MTPCPCGCTEHAALVELDDRWLDWRRAVTAGSNPAAAYQVLIAEPTDQQ